MRVKHDLALLDITVFHEEAGNLLLGETRVDTGYEEVGAWVDCTIILRTWAATIALGWTAVFVLDLFASVFRR